MTELGRRLTEEPASRTRRGLPALVGPLRRMVGPLRRMADGVGLAAEPPAIRWLFAFVVPAMLGVIGAGVAVAVNEGGLPDRPQWLLIAAGAMTFSQLARLTFQTVGGAFSIGWGEAALIICLFAVPTPWVPAVVGAGAVVAHLLLLAFGRWSTLADALRNAAALTLAGAVGALVASAVTPTFRAAVTPLEALALCAGAAGYFATTVGFVAAGAAARRRMRFTDAFVEATRRKLLMVVGNVAVGLTVVAMLSVDWRWVLLLPPAFWLLQQTYGHRLRADEERRTWQAFAGATRALNQLEEREVAVAGVHGAMKLFAPRFAEVVVLRPDGARRRYVAERGGPVQEMDATPAPRVARPDPDESGEAARTLLVGGVRVGELRLRFDGRYALAPRQQMAFSAYSDALAAALHDAATHRQLQVITERSTYDAAHDALTGLANRATILRRGDRVLRELDREAPVALLLLDIDHFKEVNDTLGHAAGDELLRTVAARLRALTRPGELLGRLGGDEFALLLTAVPEEAEPPLGDRPAVASARGGPLWSSDAQPLRHALRRARQLAEYLATPTDVSGLQVSVEASVGVVVGPAGSADMSELVRRADIAMYQAKRGGASVAWYDSEKDAASTDQLALLAELREALADPGQLFLVVQPAIDLVSGAPTGAEALVRWRHPRRGQLIPADFVRAVENSELLGPFTRHVIDRALSIAAEWAGQGLQVPIAVNMSPRSLLDPRLPADVAELLRTHRVAPQLLVLEITETVVMSELDVIDEVLAGLRELGVQLAVDDFGTGYSSLTFLTRIAVDEVKVDRAFVARMVESPEAAAIVRTTVDLGKELGLRVVAEGVETDEQKKLLAGMGCSAAQGYHFFPPMPAEKVGVVLRTLIEGAAARIIPLRADGAC
jgi:predicted signal transduction protein with EAL and GGDEF domain